LSVPQTAVDYICQTYYMADDKDEWMMQVQRFIKAHPQKQVEENKLLLIGSPIYFPNIKLPKILSDLGMTHYENRCGVRIPPDYSSAFQGTMSVPAVLKTIQEIHYEKAKSDPAIQIIDDDCSLDRYQGVIYHVLKGQLNYAYEAERLEKAAIKTGTPFICIETDYTNADAEQIRIRLEAFSELLKSDPSHKRSILKGELS
jgi:benzoyl-CoA reductase/2-hydroxyglutaryl-CoA dehydratase subunit BcrC/BadD/HgdB